MSDNNENTEAKEKIIPEHLARSNYFRIPDVSYFEEKNPYIGSENTFNYRIKPADDKLELSVWYGMKCFELSEICAEYEEELSAYGSSLIQIHLDDEYIIYKEKVENGEVAGRKTYKK